MVADNIFIALSLTNTVRIYFFPECDTFHAIGNRDKLYKNRSSQKIDSQRLFSREYNFPKTFSLTENQFSRKTYFFTIASRLCTDLAALVVERAEIEKLYAQKLKTWAVKWNNAIEKGGQLVAYKIG